MDKMKEHKKKDILECKLCNFEFSKKSQLMGHIKEHGQQVGSIYKNPKQDELCGDDSRNLKAKSILNSKRDFPYKCKHCNFVTRQESIMLKHVRGLHQAVSDLCRICKKAFLSTAQVEKHVETHLTKLYHCNVCKSSYKSNSLLRRHEIIHTGIRPFECDDCDKSFCRKDTLKTHRAKNHN